MSKTYIDFYDNWKKAKSSREYSEIREYPLFTDVGEIFGEIAKRDDCPYEIINTPTNNRENIFLPRMVLRIYQYLVPLYEASRWECYLLKEEFDLYKNYPFPDSMVIFKSETKEDDYRIKILVNNSWLEDDICIDREYIDSRFQPVNNTGLLEKDKELKDFIEWIIFGQKFSQYYLDIKEPEQIAVLLSLVCGNRIIAGSLSRITFNDRNLGFPINWEIYNNPFSIKNARNYNLGLILPSAMRPISFNYELNATFNNTFMKLGDLKMDQALAIIKCAKHYSDALATIETDTSLSWIRLVSSVEIAAEQWRKDDDIGKNVKELSEKYPEIADLLKGSINNENIKPIHDKMNINGRNGVEIKFCAFILGFCAMIC